MAIAASFSVCWSIVCVADWLHFCRTGFFLATESDEEDEEESNSEDDEPNLLANGGDVDAVDSAMPSSNKKAQVPSVLSIARCDAINLNCKWLMVIS